jgi:hypothetical protein
MIKIKNKILAPKYRSGMTLLEAIVSNLILCGAVVTVGALSTRSLSDVKLDRQYETASSIANRQLTMIDYLGIDDFLSTGRLDGEFEVGGQKFTWKAGIEELDITNLYSVTVIVQWVYHNRTYIVDVETRLNKKSSSANTTGTTGTTNTTTTTGTTGTGG